MGYDLQGALKAGVPKEEIAAVLAQKHNYDLQGALRAGVPLDDAINALVEREETISPSPSGRKMPIYKVRDNQTGRVVTFKWNGSVPPTDADMEEVFAAANMASQAPSVPTDRLSLLLEAEKRGILSPGKMDLLAEARKRGLIPETTPSAPPSLLQSIGQSAAFEGFPGGKAAADLPQTDIKPPRGVLPTLGSLAGGGVALALTKNPTAAYMANVGGAMAGSAAEDLLYGEASKEEMGIRALESGILAGIAPGAGVATERLAMPGAGKLRLKDMTGYGGPLGRGAIPEEARNALRFARENNLPIDVSEVNPSWVTSLFSGDIFAAGRYMTGRYARTTNKYLMGLRSKILENLTGAEETASIPLAAVPGKVKPALKLKTTEAYEEPVRIVQEQFGDADALVRLENMRRTAGQMLQDPRIQNAKKGRGAVASPKEWLEDFLKATENGTGKFSDIHQLQSQVNKVFYGASQEGGAPLLSSLADDLVKWDATIGQQLNEAYGVARAATKNQFLFDTVYSVLRKATKVDPNSGAEIMNGQILKSALQTPMKSGITPEKDILNKLGKEAGQKVLDELYSIAEYATYTRKLRMKEGMDIFDTKALISGGGVPAAGSMLGIGGPVAGVAVPQGTSLALTVALTGPGKKGFLRNWLLKEGHPALRMGTRMGVQFGAEQMK